MRSHHVDSFPVFATVARVQKVRRRICRRAEYVSLAKQPAIPVIRKAYIENVVVRNLFMQFPRGPSVIGGEERAFASADPAIVSVYETYRSKPRKCARSLSGPAGESRLKQQQTNHERRQCSEAFHVNVSKRPFRDLDVVVCQPA